MRSNKKRGMVLIMTMMAITLVLIMVHSLMQTTGLGLSGSSSFYDRESALQAAQSGMDYVVTKLQSNKAWRGDGNDEFGSFDSCGISVVESYGNVVGLLKNKTGTKSAFRVKFSFEDTSDATLSKVPCSRFAEGGGEEPKPDFSIAMPYVSINNLNNTSATIAYRANNNGKGLAKSTANLEIVSGGGVTADYACHVPPQRIYVIVEGLSGKGLRDCEDPKSANTIANNNAAIARRYIESYFTFNAPVLRGSAASAEKTINVAIANKMFIKTKGFRSKKSTVPAAGSMHSNTSIKITGGKLNTYDGKLYAADPSAVTFNKDEDKYWFKDDDGNKKRMSFPNNSIVKANGGVEAIDYKMLATAAPSTENSIQPGMYQWHKASDCPAGKNYYELRYYPGDDGSTEDASGRPVPRISSLYEIVTVGDVSEEEDTGGAEGDEQTHKKCAMGPAGKIGFVTNSEGRITEPTLILNGKLHCDGNLTISTDVSEVKRVLPKVQIGKYTPVGSNGKPISKKAEEGVLNASGDITLVSTVKGNGAVVTYNGDVSFVGSSALDSGSDGVAIYANNINLGNMELITTETPDGNALDTSSGSGSQVTVDSDGNKTFTPSAEAMFCILGEFCTYSNGSLNLEAAKTKIREYFAENFGVRIEVMSGFDLRSDPGVPVDERVYGYSVKIKFLNEDGGNADSNEYTIHTKTVGGGAPELYMCISYTLDDIPNPQIDTLTAPAAAVDENFEDPDDGGDDEPGAVVNPAKDIVKKFGNVCYGDQVLNGVVYARNNFKAMLSKKYKLVINGAVRAEKGSIQAECSGVDLTYDESCLKKLLPTYSKLNRELWNCW